MAARRNTIYPCRCHDAAPDWKGCRKDSGWVKEKWKKCVDEIEVETKCYLLSKRMTDERHMFKPLTFA